MKKICHISTAHQNNDNRIFAKECTFLGKEGYEVYLVCQGENGRRQGVNCISLPAPKGRIYRILVTVKIAYKKAKEIDADLYHLHDPELLPIALKLKKRHKKVIFDSHENYTAQIANKKYIAKIIRKTIANLYYRYETYICKRIDAVIFPCPINGKDIFKNRSQKSLFLDNYPIMQDFYDYYEENKCGRSATNIKLCYTGGLTEERGIKVLAQAAVKSRTKLILAGRFSSSEFKNEILDIGKHYIEYKGICNKEQIREIYCESDIGMCTLLNVGQYNATDNFATKVYEYMAMGLPVILSESPFSHKILKKYPFGILVNPEDIDDIVNAINKLKGDKILRKEMGVVGRSLVYNFFNWNRESKKLVELYDILLKDN